MFDWVLNTPLAFLFLILNTFQKKKYLINNNLNVEFEIKGSNLLLITKSPECFNIVFLIFYRTSKVACHKISHEKTFSD